MAELTPQERALVDEDRAMFKQLRAEAAPLLLNFFELLQVPAPGAALADVQRVIPTVDRWMSHQVVGADDRDWIVARLGLLVGEYVAQRWGGSWFFQDRLDTVFFCRAVVGELARAPNPHAMVDPFLVAATYVDDPPGRSLVAYLREVDDDIAASPPHPAAEAN